MKYLLLIMVLFTVACAEDENNPTQDVFNTSECIRKAGFGPIETVIINVNEVNASDPYTCTLGNKECTYDTFIPDGETFYVSEVNCG